MTWLSTRATQIGNRDARFGFFENSDHLAPLNSDFLMTAHSSREQSTFECLLRGKLTLPDRGQDRQHVGRGHLGHGHRPDARERIGAQTARPDLPAPRSTLKTQQCSDSTRQVFVGRLDAERDRAEFVLELAP